MTWFTLILLSFLMINTDAADVAVEVLQGSIFIVRGVCTTQSFLLLGALKLYMSYAFQALPADSMTLE